MAGRCDKYYGGSAERISSERRQKKAPLHGGRANFIGETVVNHLYVVAD